MTEERPKVDPEDWESQALFPARLLASFPREARDTLQRAGAELYLLVLEGLDEMSGPQGSQVASELRALMEEILDLARWARSTGALAEVAEALEQAVRRTKRGLEMAGLEPPKPPPMEEAVQLRPFLRDMASDSRYYRAVASLGKALAALNEPLTPRRSVAALAADLAWIQTVLAQHIAPRGEISSLGAGESALCWLARGLAEGLEAPIERLRIRGDCAPALRGCRRGPSRRHGLMRRALEVDAWPATPGRSSGDSRLFLALAAIESADEHLDAWLQARTLNTEGEDLTVDGHGRGLHATVKDVRSDCLEIACDTLLRSLAESRRAERPSTLRHREEGLDRNHGATARLERMICDRCWSWEDDGGEGESGTGDG